MCVSVCLSRFVDHTGHTRDDLYGLRLVGRYANYASHFRSVALRPLESVRYTPTHARDRLKAINGEQWEQQILDTSE